MNSPRGIARCEFALRGLNYEWGSLPETFAILAFNRQQKIQFLQNLAVVNAIIQGANQIVSAGSGGGGSSQSDGVSKVMETLQGLLIPEDKPEKEKKAAKIKKLLEDEVSKGPFTVRAMSSSRSRGKKR